MTNEKDKSLISHIWRFFISVKLTVVLLIFLAVTSAAGTIIPQTGSPEQYIQMYGSFGYALIRVLDLSDMYHSWWFRSLIGLLTINITICTIDRWPATWKSILPGNFNPESLTKRKSRNDFTDPRIPAELKPLYTAFMKNQFTVKGIHTRKEGFTIYGEKGRWAGIGVPVVHLSVVLILAGALVGSFFGFDGYVNVPEGGFADRIQLRNSNEMKALGFEVVCNDFNIEYYPSGAVKEYRSDLQIRQNGDILAEKSIVVNDPLKYGGIRFFQSSYGALPPENFEVKITSAATDQSKKYMTRSGAAIPLPDDSGMFVITGFNRDYHFKDVELGQAVEGQLRVKDKAPVPVVLPLRFPTFDKMRKGAWVISVVNYDSQFYTGLQVRKDPGVYLVYLGFIFILGGCWIIFFNANQKILVEVKPMGENSAVSIYGATSSRHKMDFTRQIEKITRKLKLL